jgi:SAM-dependent methyltransferase
MSNYYEIVTAFNQTVESLGEIAVVESDESRNRVIRAQQVVQKYVGSIKGKDVLDVGCSIGLNAVTSAKLGANVIGIDRYIFPEAGDNAFRIERPQLEHVQDVWRDVGAKLVFGDIEQQLPFENESFDVVTCHAVIEHLSGSHKHLFGEMKRVLRPGGYLVVSTPNLTYIAKRVRMLFGRSPNWDIKDFFNSEKAFIGHVREFTYDELRTMFEMSGLNVIHASAYPTYFKRKWLKDRRALRVVYYLLSFLGRGLGDHCFIVVVK